MAQTGASIFAALELAPRLGNPEGLELIEAKGASRFDDRRLALLQASLEGLGIFEGPAVTSLNFLQRFTDLNNKFGRKAHS